jgi:hypothetical protein
MPSKPFFDPEIDQLRSAIARRHEYRRIAIALSFIIAGLLVAAGMGWVL